MFLDDKLLLVSLIYSVCLCIVFLLCVCWMVGDFIGMFDCSCCRIWVSNVWVVCFMFVFNDWIIGSLCLI